MKMNSKKFFFLLCGTLGLLIILVGAGAVGGNMLLQKQSDKLTTLKVDNKAIEMQQTALIQAKKEIERYNEIDQIAKSVVPQDKDQAKTIREIVKIANENRVPIMSFDFESSTLGSVPSRPGASATATTQSAAAAATNAQLSQIKPVEGIPGVYTLEIKMLGGTVNYQNFLRFLEGLEKNRRTAHVNKIKLEPDEPSGGAQIKNFELTLYAYLKP